MLIITKNQKTQSPPSSPSIWSLHGRTLIIRGMTPEKWESIQELDIFPSLDLIILTEHQLSAEFRPDEILRSGWDFHAVSGAITNLPRKGYRGQRHRGGLALLTRNSKRFSVKMKSLSGVVNKITGDNCKCVDKRRGGQGHGSGSLPILHQAVTWSLTSPLYNDTIHLTGVYIFPDENQLQEFFDTLIAHSNQPPHEPHIYAGDFNAYTAEELENHITPQDLRTLLRRSGDINPAHSPAPPLTSATVPAADYRGRLLLNMTNSLELIITNGRFPVPPPTLRPYTFFRKPNTHSVLDYNLIAKHHVPLIQKCEVLRDSLPAGVTDHMPIHLHLDLPTTPTPTLKPTSQSSPPRTLYHSKRLKDKDTKEAFTKALAKKSVNMHTMGTSFVGKVRDVRQIVEAQIGGGVADMVEFEAQVSGHEATEKANIIQAWQGLLNWQFADRFDRDRPGPHTMLALAL